LDEFTLQAGRLRCSLMNYSSGDKPIKSKSVMKCGRECDCVCVQQVPISVWHFLYNTIFIAHLTTIEQCF